MSVNPTQANKQTFKVWQPQRAARSKRPNTPSDGSKHNGFQTTNQAVLIPKHVSRQDRAHEIYRPDSPDIAPTAREGTLGVTQYNTRQEMHHKKNFKVIIKGLLVGWWGPEGRKIPITNYQMTPSKRGAGGGSATHKEPT